jgi:flagellar protein FliS
MNMNAQAYNQYKKATVETVAPEKLLLMLYEGAIKSIKNARSAIGTNDIDRAHQQIMKAQDIILEFMSTLNMDYEVSNSLLALYEYLHWQLVQANIKKEITILDEVEGILAELRDTWVEAAKGLKTSTAPVSQTVEKKVSIDPGAAAAKIPERREPSRLAGLNIQG